MQIWSPYLQAVDSKTTDNTEQGKHKGRQFYKENPKKHWLLKFE